MDHLDGCIFGWSLTPNLNAALIHHVGLILHWDGDNLWDTVIAHYGINSQGIVHVETLGDAVDRSSPSVIHINTERKATF